MSAPASSPSIFLTEPAVNTVIGRIIISVGFLVIAIAAALKDVVPSLERIHIETTTIALLILAILPWSLDYLKSFKGFGVEVEFKQYVDQKLAPVAAQVNEIKDDVASVKRALSELESDYIAQCEIFDPKGEAKDLDGLATELKAFASALPSLDFLLDICGPEATQAQLFGIATAVSVRPDHRFLEPLCEVVASASSKPDLGIRLKAMYRLVMAIEGILRTDNRRQVRRVDSLVRRRCYDVLKTLEKHPSCQHDLFHAKGKSIVPRINRAIKQAEADNLGEMDQMLK